MSLLRVERVTKQFGSLVALSDISISVAPGEVCAVIGPNGAGKTTLFNLITGFVVPSSGRVLLDGADISALPPVQRVWRGMARTFQTAEVFSELTVSENFRIAVESARGLRLRPLLSRHERASVSRRVEELAVLGGLSAHAQRKAGELSHGDQRATEILMALALEPRLLLLDEPTAGMGDQETYDVALLIRRLHREQKLTIVLIEHDMRVVFNLASHIVVLAEGRMLAEGTPAEIAADDGVQNAYLGKVAA